MNQGSLTKKLTLSALVMALYIALMVVTQSFAFGQYQVRFATALYALSGIYPFLVLPLGLANLLSNVLLGGLGPLDMIGGMLVGIAASGVIALTRNSRFSVLIAVLSIALVVGFGVPIWLSYLLNLPYLAVALPLLVGQSVAGVCGAVLLAALRRRLKTNINKES